MPNNKNLHAAASAKKDEFYTQLSDIENELKHYKAHFKDKVVFCNCDDPYESNFFKYFALNFNYLQLKKLICTCYSLSPVMGSELNCYIDRNKGNNLTFLTPEHSNSVKADKKPYKVIITEVTESSDEAYDLTDIEYLLKNKKNVMTFLNEDGDFRSDECIELLKESDIVVTNPPFSLFREYVAQLIEYNKEFIIIGNQNAITYKEIFPLIKENKIWLGYGFNGGNAYFSVPDNTKNYAKGVYDEKTNLVKFRNCCWFTNLDIQKRHEDLILYKNYTPEDYPTYENYDAINVDKTAEIPCDYDGIMGVPITFMDKFNPEQFEIIGMAEDNGKGYSGKESKWDGKNPHCVINGKNKFKRIFIKRRQQ